MSNSLGINELLSAIADEVNIVYKGRALFVNNGNIAAMAEGWRDRLRAALKRSGKSMRAASLEADCGPGYVFDILQAKKEPTIDRLLALAGVLGVSLSWLLYGFEIGKQEEELLTRFAQLTDKQRQAILDLADPRADNDR